MVVEKIGVTYIDGMNAVRSRKIGRSEKELDRLFERAEIVAIPSKKALTYIYLDKEGWQALKNGEIIRTSATLTPFASVKSGICEAWEYITIAINDII